jgi:hypothetical protein
VPTAVAVRGVRRYTCHGGGPADGALYSAVSAIPVSSTRAGQPSAGPPPAVFGVSVLSTLGEIIYAGTSTALVAAIAPEQALGRALARFQLSTGIGLAISPC